MTKTGSDYQFEVQRSINGDTGYVEVASIETALLEITPDGFLRAKYDRLIDERIFIGQVELAYEDVVGRSDEEIIAIIDEEVSRRHS